MAYHVRMMAVLALAGIMLALAASMAHSEEAPKLKVQTCTITFDPNTKKYFYSDCGTPVEYSSRHEASPH